MIAQQSFVFNNLNLKHAYLFFIPFHATGVDRNYSVGGHRDNYVGIPNVSHGFRLCVCSTFLQKLLGSGSIPNMILAVQPPNIGHDDVSSILTAN